MSDISAQMLDLRTQYASIRKEVDDAIARVVQSQICIYGPEVKALEEEIAAYCGSKHAVACASGTDAILLALMGIDLEPGDEVIIPTFTFFATAGCITRLGGKPVFADIDEATYNLDLKSARGAAAKCSRLKAIMPVHLYGQVGDLDGCLALGEELGVPVIEDAAQAIGALDGRGHRAGSRGVFGCFSFYPTKNLGAMGDAGMVITDDEAKAERLRSLGNHGMKPKYYHREVGVNSRMDAIQAAILRVKMPHLEAWSAKRRANAAFYDRAFADAGAKTSAVPLSDDEFPLRTPQPASAPSTHIYHQYVIRVPGAIRDQVREQLAARNVGTEIYYPVPLHEQECYVKLGGQSGALPVAERAARETLALPVHPELSDAQLDHVASSVIEIVSRTSCAVQA